MLVQMTNPQNSDMLTILFSLFFFYYLFVLICFFIFIYFYKYYLIYSADNTFQYANPIDSAVAGSDSQRKKRSFILYAIAMLNLFLYIIIVTNSAATKYHGQSYGIVIWVILLDFCM